MGIAFGTLQALAFRVLGTFFLMLVGVITARALSVSDLGVFTTTTVVIAIAGSLVASFSSAAGFFVANKGVPAPNVAANAVILSLAIGVAALVAGFAFKLLVGGHNGTLGLLVGVTLFPLIARYALSGVFLGQGRIAHYSFALHGHGYVAFVFLIVWVVLLDHRTVEDALGAWIVAQYAALLASCLLVPTWWRALAARPDYALIWSFVTFGTVTGLAGVISYLNYRIDQLLVRGFDGAEGAGIYAPAVVLAESVWLFSTAISVASYSRVGSLSRSEAGLLTVRAVRHTWMTAFVAMLGVIIFANLIIILLYGSKYEDAANSLRILSIGTALYAPQAVISNYFTVSLGRPSISLGLAACSCLTGTIFGIVLIPQLGYIGGAWATLLSYAVTATISTALFLRLSGTNVFELVHYRRADITAYLDLGRELRARLAAAGMAGARTRS